MRANRVAFGIVLASAIFLQWKRDRGFSVTQPPVQVRQQISADPAAVPPNQQSVADTRETLAKNVHAR